MPKRIKALILILFVFFVPIIYSNFTSQPKGTSISTDYYNVSDIEFISDITFDKNGQAVNELNIFKEQLKMIEEADKFIVMDVFLFNDSYDRNYDKYPENTKILTETLVNKQKENNNLEIVFITDPINIFYGEQKSWALEDLKKAGIKVIVTDLDKMKDSNIVYSGYYRILKPILKMFDDKFIKNPLEPNGENVSIYAISKLANFKGNHRKVLVTDKEAMITSANPHDASAYHSNVAFKFKSPVINEIIKGEDAVAEFSSDYQIKAEYIGDNDRTKTDTKIRYLTEEGIHKAILENIKNMQSGDNIDIGIFYISETSILKALENASARGVKIRIIADPNKGAFGIKRDGTPNRVVLSKLVEKCENIEVKWYNTKTEQYHSKASQFKTKDETRIILGSANYTRRNLKGYNLESDVEVICDKNSKLSNEVSQYFNMIWDNKETNYTLPFETYIDDNIKLYIKHILKESVGVCTY